jgi:hypothetical protein
MVPSSMITTILFAAFLLINRGMYVILKQLSCKINIDFIVNLVKINTDKSW